MAACPMTPSGCLECGEPADSTEHCGLCVAHGEELSADLAAAQARYNEPPCLDCGARSAEEAGTMCRCGGDTDSCHGVTLWPDG